MPIDIQPHGLQLKDNLTATAFALAERAVIVDIETEGTRVGSPTERRWDLTAPLGLYEHSPELVDQFREALAFGVVRGLLRFDAANPNIVQILRPLGQ